LWFDNNSTESFDFDCATPTSKFGIAWADLKSMNLLRELQTCESEAESRRKLWDHVELIDYGFSMRLPIVRCSVLAELLEGFTVVLGFFSASDNEVDRILHGGIQKGKVTTL
jgi:hypothetical protein